MDIIMINDSKLKIMLTHEDMKDFNIEASKLDYSNTETKRLLWDILDHAKKSIGFDTDGSRVLLQLYPSRDGGCEMFVTKIENDYYEEKDEDLNDDHLFHYRATSPTSTSQIKKGVYSFERLDWLITVCKQLKSSGYKGESSAYISDGKIYYLFIDQIDTAEYLAFDEYSFISEYGHAENTEASESFIAEHGKMLCEEHAVDILGAL